MSIAYRWTGEAFEPLRRYHNEVNSTFVVGQVYWLEEILNRSDASHRHEFAWLREAWQSLPESLADQYASPEHLRKRALIQAGFFDEQIIDVGSVAGALRVAAAWRSRDDFALVIVRGVYVFVRTAKSQSRRAMGAKVFQDSKTKIMEIIAEMIGVTPEQLSKQEATA